MINYQQFNEIIIKDRTPLPLINELKDRLYGAKQFTALNLKNKYHHIKIKPEHE